jgi:acetate kinase
MTRASLLTSRGAAIRAGSPPSSGLARVFVCGCGASLCSVASGDPSSTAMAFNPAAVNLSA